MHSNGTSLDALCLSFEHITLSFFLSEPLIFFFFFFFFEGLYFALKFSSYIPLPRPSAVPVVPRECGGLAGLVHAALELLAGALHAGGRQRGATVVWQEGVMGGRLNSYPFMLR